MLRFYRYLSRNLQGNSDKLKTLVDTGYAKRFVNSEEDSKEISDLVAQTGAIINEYMVISMRERLFCA
jgi:hypothetical protein